jgi:hypothetical protein
MVVLLESGTAIHDSSMKVAAMRVLDSDGVKHIGKIAELRQPGSWVLRLVWETSVIRKGNWASKVQRFTKIVPLVVAKPSTVSVDTGPDQAGAGIRIPDNIIPPVGIAIAEPWRSRKRPVRPTVIVLGRVVGKYVSDQSGGSQLRMCPVSLASP